MSLDPAPLAPNRRHYAALVFMFAAFALYGSIAPLRVHWMPFTDAVERFRVVLAQPLAMPSRSDWLANFLLLLPFGFCLMAAICCDRTHLGGPALPCTIVACLALAAFVEFAQIYFPPRVSSINDITAQGFGGTTGALIWLGCGQRLTVHLRQLWHNFGSRSTAHLLLPLYLFVLLIVQTLPFDFTLSPVELFRKYKQGRIHWMPFTASAGGLVSTNKHFWNLALFAPMGLILAHMPGRIRQRGRLVLLAGLSVAAAIEFVQLLAFSRHFDSTDILTGTAAVWAAWFVAHRYSVQMQKPELRAVFMAGCVMILIFMEWQPFDFVTSLSAARLRVREIKLLPFVDYLGGDYVNALEDGIHKTLLFAALGALLAFPTPASKAALYRRWSFAIAVAVVLESGQLFLPTRYAGLTDVLVAATSSGISLFVVNRLAGHSRTHQGNIHGYSEHRRTYFDGGRPNELLPHQDGPRTVIPTQVRRSR